MPILYNLHRKQDKFLVENTQAGTITYTLEQLQHCSEYISVSTGDILTGVEQEINIPKDGVYNLILSDGVNPDISITLKSYLQLQQSLINDIDVAMCDCGCEHNDCTGNDYHTECNLLLTTTTKMQAYKGLTSPEGAAHYEAVFDTYQCVIDEAIYAQLLDERISGHSGANKTLLKRILALNFLALYYYELQASLPEDDAYVREKFQGSRILSCINTLGLNINDLEQTILNMGLFTLSIGAYVNLAPTCVGDNTIIAANRATTVLTLAMFTTGTTPAYNDPEGDPVDALRVDTLATTGTLQYNGINMIAGDVVSAADINLGLFTHVAPNQDALVTASFNFSLRDTGSGQWVSGCA